MATTYYPTYKQAYDLYVGAGGGVSVPFFKKAGQSNVQGLARRSDLYAATLNTANPSFTRQFKTRIWNPTAGALQPLQVGTAADGTGNELGQQHPEAPQDYENGFGPEIGFAQRLEQEGKNNAVIAKCGKGASAIARWQKAAGDLYPQLKTTIVNARAAIVATGGTPVEQGFYWDQWEADVNSTTYQADLQQFYNDLRADGLVGATEKFVLCAAQDTGILSQQRAFVNANAAARLLTPASITYIPNDKLHYDARTQLAIGGDSLYNLYFNSTGSIAIPPPAAVAGETIEETSPKWVFAPAAKWQSSDNTVASGGKNLYAPTDSGTTATVGFTGTQVRLNFHTESVGGNVDVFIDDVYNSTFSQYSASKVGGGVFTTVAVPDGSHKLVLKPAVSGKGQFIWVDKATVLDNGGTFYLAATPPAAENFRFNEPFDRADGPVGNDWRNVTTQVIKDNALQGSENYADGALPMARPEVLDGSRDYFISGSFVHQPTTGTTIPLSCRINGVDWAMGYLNIMGGNNFSLLLFDVLNKQPSQMGEAALGTFALVPGTTYNYFIAPHPNGKIGLGLNTADGSALLQGMERTPDARIPASGQAGIGPGDGSTYRLLDFNITQI